MFGQTGPITQDNQQMKLTGGYSGFQVTGVIKGFFGFEIFDSRIFLGKKIWQVFFW